MNIKKIYNCQKENLHRSIWNFMHNKKRVRFFSLMFPKLYISYFYRNWIGLFPNFSNPRNINEYLIANSLKIKDNQLVADCADKVKVREIIKEYGYDDILNNIIGIYESFEEIDFNALPEKFVLKINNASGRNYICKDKNKINIEALREEVSKWIIDTNFGIESCEWHYRLIKPLILIENYLDSIDSISVIDYKFNCSRGKVFSCFVGYDRDPLDTHGKVQFDDYDNDWNRTNRIKIEYHPNQRFIRKPVNHKRMLEIAAKLSEQFDFVRVDFYEVDNKIIFGEMTFTPNSNVMVFYNEKALVEMLDFCNNK